MPLDPFFTRDGYKTTTFLGQPRTQFSAEQRAAVDRLLALPDKERGQLQGRISDQLRRHERVTETELLFFRMMKRMYKGRAFKFPATVELIQKRRRRSKRLVAMNGSAPTLTHVRQSDGLVPWRARPNRLADLC